jgi:hypothetical protein
VNHDPYDSPPSHRFNAHACPRMPSTLRLQRDTEQLFCCRGRQSDYCLACAWAPPSEWQMFWNPPRGRLEESLPLTCSDAACEPLWAPRGAFASANRATIAVHRLVDETQVRNTKGLALGSSEASLTPRRHTCFKLGANISIWGTCYRFRSAKTCLFQVLDGRPPVSSRLRAPQGWPRAMQCQSTGTFSKLTNRPVGAGRHRAKGFTWARDIWCCCYLAIENKVLLLLLHLYSLAIRDRRIMKHHSYDHNNTPRS